MITIDKDELCKSCDRNINDCEGSGCDEARDNYIDDHGLVEDSPQIFGDLKINDPIYCIHENKLFVDKVESVLHNSNGLQIGTLKFSGQTFKPDKSASPEKGMFVQKQHAITAYTKRMHNTIERMMKNIIEFEKIK